MDNYLFGVTDSFSSFLFCEFYIIRDLWCHRKIFYFNLEVFQLMAKGMTPKDYFNLAFGSMIGIGWVISVPAWMSSAGSVGTVIAIILTMCMIIPIGFVYGELTSSLHVSGGEFAYTYKALGKLPAFICGWFLILGYLIILPWVAISVAALFAYLFPILNSLPLYTILGSQIYLPHLIISFSMVGIIVYLNWKGTRISSTFQNIATMLMIVTFLLFIIGGIISGNSANMEPLLPAGNISSGIVLAMASILFFMNGFDTIPKTAAEADSSINYSDLGKVITGTIVTGSLLYILIVFSSRFIMPAIQLVKLGELPLISAFEAATGSQILTGIIVFGVLMGVITTFNGFLFAGSRLVTSFAKAGFLPKLFSITDKKNGTPRNSLLFMLIISIAGIFLGQGLLAPLIVMGGISFLIAWFFMALSSVSLRKKRPGMLRPYKAPGGIKMGYIATILSGLFLIFMLVPGTPISLKGVEYILFIIWAGAGMTIYALNHNQKIRIEELTNKKGEITNV